MSQPSTDALRDPICGMTVAADTPHRSSYRGKELVFCSSRCRERFDADPEGALAATRPQASEHQTRKGRYTCPMHPEIVRDEPGSCPICGMALEAVTVAPEEEENPELVDMSRRLWCERRVELARLPACHERDGAGQPSVAGDLGERFRLDPAYLGDTGGPLGRLALLRAGRRFGAPPKPQHVQLSSGSASRWPMATASSQSSGRGSFRRPCATSTAR